MLVGACISEYQSRDHRDRLLSIGSLSVLSKMVNFCIVSSIHGGFGGDPWPQTQIVIAHGNDFTIINALLKILEKCLI